MLRIDLAEVRAGPVETAGQIEQSHPIFADGEVMLAAPVTVRGRLSSAGEGKYFWRASVGTVLRLECRRCLSPVDVPFEQLLDLLFATEDESLDDDVGCYVIPDRAAVLDLRDAVREELVLSVPRYVECGPDCRGLCPRCGANLNAGPCECRPERDPRWAALSGLPRSRADEE